MVFLPVRATLPTPHLYTHGPPGQLLQPPKVGQNLRPADTVDVFKKEAMTHDLFDFPSVLLLTDCYSPSIFIFYSNFYSILRHLFHFSHFSVFYRIAPLFILNYLTVFHSF